MELAVPVSSVEETADVAGLTSRVTSNNTYVVVESDPYVTLVSAAGAYVIRPAGIADGIAAASGRH